MNKALAIIGNCERLKKLDEFGVLRGRIVNTTLFLLY